MNTYVMRGVILDYKLVKDRYDQFEPYFDLPRGFCVLYDGMNGKYVAIGEVLGVSDEDGGFPQPVFSVEAAAAAGEAAEHLRNRIKDLAGTEVGPIGIHVISHYR